MKRFIIPAVAIAGMLFASTAEAGPIRNLVKRACGKGKAVAKKVVKAPAAVLGANRAALGANVGSCANGRCSK